MLTWKATSRWWTLIMSSCWQKLFSRSSTFVLVKRQTPAWLSLLTSFRTGTSFGWASTRTDRSVVGQRVTFQSSCAWTALSWVISPSKQQTRPVLESRDVWSLAIAVLTAFSSETSLLFKANRTILERPTSSRKASRCTPRTTRKGGSTGESATVGSLTQLD